MLVTLQETPEESYYRRNLGPVSHVQARDKAQESIVVAALARLLPHFLRQKITSSLSKVSCYVCLI